jgi:hypothetical protein
MILYKIGKKNAKLKRIAPEGKTAGGKLGMFFTTSVRHRPSPRGLLPPPELARNRHRWVRRLFEDKVLWRTPPLSWAKAVCG